MCAHECDQKVKKATICDASLYAGGIPLKVPLMHVAYPIYFYSVLRLCLANNSRQHSGGSLPLIVYKPCLHFHRPYSSLVSGLLQRTSRLELLVRISHGIYLA